MSKAYSCCTFRGSVAALDLKTGALLWKTSMIDVPMKTIRDKDSGGKVQGPAGAAVWADHVLPFQRSIVSPAPTATQSVAVGHDRPASAPPAGTGCRAQLVPSQRSAAGPEPSLPTAVHAVADVHLTAARAVGPAAISCGVHAAPFQLSATGPAPPLPTAMHAVADVHEIADRLLAAAGAARIAHDEPFQPSASPNWCPLASW